MYLNSWGMRRNIFEKGKLTGKIFRKEVSSESDFEDMDDYGLIM